MTSQSHVDYPCLKSHIPFGMLQCCMYKHIGSSKDIQLTSYYHYYYYRHYYYGYITSHFNDTSFSYNILMRARL